MNMWFPDDIPVKQAKNVLDNKVVLMGSFASYGGVPPDPAHGMMRIKPDGSFDPTSAWATVRSGSSHRRPSFVTRASTIWK